jgi:hypothetical protein
MKKSLSLLLSVTFVLTLMVVPPAGAQESTPSPPPLSTPTQQATTIHSDPPGELIIADVLVMRPLGMAACVIGLAGALLAWPFAAITNSCDRVCNELIVKPYKYTFERPLGQMDYGDPDFTAYDMGR